MSRVTAGGRAVTRHTPRGARPFAAGRKVNAVCPKCRAWIVPGEMVIQAPGRGFVLKHTSCRKAG